MTSRAWSWRHAIISSSIEPTTRHVLLTISCFMNDVGGGCYPTIAALAEATGLSERAVVKHIGIAQELGWLSVKKHGLRGRQWKNNEYAAKWPDLVEKIAQPEPRVRKTRSKPESIEDAPVAAESDADLFGNADNSDRGSERGSLPQAASESAEVVNVVPRGSEPNDIEVVNHVPPILPVYFQNPSKARKRAEGGKDFSKFWEDWPLANRPDNLDHVRNLFEKLSAVDQLIAQGCAETYRRVCATRGVRPKMVTFLKDRLFEDFHDAPPVDRDGDFVITPNRPEWPVWLGDVQATFGEPGVQSTLRTGRIVRKDRWPPGHEPGRVQSAGVGR